MDSSWLQIKACHLSERAQGVDEAPHRHRDPQWHLCTDGDIIVEIDGAEHRCGPGQHILVPPWAFRRIIRRRRGVYLMLRFSSSCIGTDWAGSVGHLPDLVVDDLSTLLERLAGGAGSGDALTEVLILRLLFAAQETADSEQSLVIADRQAAEDLVAQAVTHIRAHLGEPLTRADIATACHCSPAHLGRLCRDRRACTPLELVTAERMRVARELLLEDRRSIGAIAAQVGFATTSHFGVVFKKTHGMSPRDFRRGGGRLWWHRQPDDGGPIL